MNPKVVISLFVLFFFSLILVTIEYVFSFFGDSSWLILIPIAGLSVGVYVMSKISGFILENIDNIGPYANMLQNFSLFMKNIGRDKSQAFYDEFSQDPKDFRKKHGF